MFDLFKSKKALLSEVQSLRQELEQVKKDRRKIWEDYKFLILALQSRSHKKDHEK